MDYRTDSPQLLLDFLSYHETIKAHSQRTVEQAMDELHEQLFDPYVLIVR